MSIIPHAAGTPGVLVDGMDVRKVPALDCITVRVRVLSARHLPVLALILCAHSRAPICKNGPYFWNGRRAGK